MRKTLSVDKRVKSEPDDPLNYLSTKQDVETKFEEFCREHDKDWYALSSPKEKINLRR